MLPASDLSEILANLSALNLQPNTAAQILARSRSPCDGCWASRASWILKRRTRA